MVDGKPIVRRIQGKVRPVAIAKIKELRILKRDIRRRYMDMYQNVMNMYDSSLLLRFIQEFWTPTCKLEINIISIGARRKERNGQLNIYNDWIQQQLMFPDGIMRLTDITIHTTWGEQGSRVACSFMFTGVKMFEFPMAVVSEEEVSDEGRRRTQEMVLPKVGPICMTRCVRPIEIRLIGTLTFYLDVNHYIERCVFQETKIKTKEIKG